MIKRGLCAVLCSATRVHLMSFKGRSVQQVSFSIGGNRGGSRSAQDAIRKKLLLPPKRRRVFYTARFKGGRGGETDLFSVNAYDTKIRVYISIRGR